MDRAAYAGMNAVESRHWWFVARRAIIDTLIRRALGAQRGRTILEAGCGTGGNLAMLSQHGKLSAFEYDAQARTIAAEKKICPVDAGALPDAVPATDTPFAIVAMMDVLEHIDDDRASLHTLGNMLAADGRLLITVPALPLLWSSHDELHHHKRRYTRASLRKALSDAGLQVESLGYFNCLLFPLALAQRLVAKLSRHADPVDALPSPPVNAVLRAIFAAERFLIARVPMPIGLSLYAVARK